VGAGSRIEMVAGIRISLEAGREREEREAMLWSCPI
jgi:hypothetical protein